MTCQIPPYSEPGLGEENGSQFMLLILFNSSNCAEVACVLGAVLRAGYMQMSKRHNRLWPLGSASCRAHIEYSTH